jgi:hypothetical protein
VTTFCLDRSAGWPLVTTSVKTCAAGRCGCDHILVREPSFGAVGSSWLQGNPGFLSLQAALSAQSIIPRRLRKSPRRPPHASGRAIFCDATVYGRGCHHPLCLSRAATRVGDECLIWRRCPIGARLLHGATRGLPPAAPAGVARDTVDRSPPGGDAADAEGFPLEHPAAERRASPKPVVVAGRGAPDRAISAGRSGLGAAVA